MAAAEEEEEDEEENEEEELTTFLPFLCHFFLSSCLIELFALKSALISWLI